MQVYCDVNKWTILKRTSPEVKCLHPTSSKREMCTSSVSNMIYHKASHGAAFYTLNGKNVNVMLESTLCAQWEVCADSEAGDCFKLNDYRSMSFRYLFKGRQLWDLTTDFTCK